VSSLPWNQCPLSRGIGVQFHPEYAVNQLAQAYLERKQVEVKRRIPHDAYAQELQKVRIVGPHADPQFTAPFG
jgi:homoserine trans-succinylase